jgi:hypothetical protein
MANQNRSEEDKKLAEIASRIRSDEKLRNDLVRAAVDTLRTHGVKLSDEEVKILTGAEKDSSATPQGCLFVPGLVLCRGTF